MEKTNLIVEKTRDFGIAVVTFCELLDEKRKYVVSKQLLRSVTSIGANVFEAQHAESKADFIHEMKIAVKEANETLYWLFICERSKNYPANSSLKQMVEEIIRIISKIIISSKGRFGTLIMLSVISFSTITLLKLKTWILGV